MQSSPTIRCKGQMDFQNPTRYWIKPVISLEMVTL